MYKKNDIDSFSSKELVSRDYKNESELQNIIARNPRLLTSETDKDVPITTVSTEVALDAGEIDILLVDAQGLLTVVEVKLERNPECRQKVVAQIISYASALQLLSFEALDERVGGKLAAALRAFSSDDDEYTRRRAWCEECLRTGFFRLVIAVDHAPNELIRSWQYLQAQTGFDLRLVAVQRLSIGTNEEVLSPSTLVSYESNRVKDPRSTRPVFDRIIAAYNRENAQDYPAARRVGPTNYAIYVAGWPKNMHFEFNDWVTTNRVSVEVMANTKSVPGMENVLEALRERVSSAVSDDSTAIEWHTNYRNPDTKQLTGWARLQYFYSGDEYPDTVAAKMKHLIEEACPIINIALTTEQAGAY